MCLRQRRTIDEGMVTKLMNEKNNNNKINKVQKNV